MGFCFEVLKHLNHVDESFIRNSYFTIGGRSVEGSKALNVSILELSLILQVFSIDKHI